MIEPTIIEHKPQRWQAMCPRCGYFHKGHSSDLVVSEAERCEGICLNRGVPLKAYLGSERDRGDRDTLADKRTNQEQ